MNAPPGMFYNGDPGYPSNSSSYSQLSDFGPRVGLVWDPTGSGKQTIRVGYGLFYHAPMTFYFADGFLNPPWSSQIGIPSPAGGFANPYQGFPGGNPSRLPVLPRTCLLSQKAVTLPICRKRCPLLCTNGISAMSFSCPLIG